jgi:hypothetical protein
MTSATFNDDFYLTILNPVPFSIDSTWKYFEKNATQLDSIKIREKWVRFLLPSYRLSMSIDALWVERPWFNLCDAQRIRKNQSSSSSSVKIAYVEEIIYSKNFKLENYAQSKSEIVISKNGKMQKSIYFQASSTMESNNTTIIGFVYRII